MDTNAQQATTSSSSHRDNADSEGARRSFRPGHRLTLQNSVAISDRCDRTEGEKSESENTVGPVNGRSAAATAARQYRAENKQTHRQTELKTLPPRLPSAWVNTLFSRPSLAWTKN